LEDELRDLGSLIEYPPTPDLARAARRRLEEDEAQTPRRSWSWAQFLSPRWAVAAVLVLIAIAPVLSPGMRDAVGDLFVTGQGAGSAAGGNAARVEERAASEEDPSSSLAESSGTEAGDMQAAGDSAVPQSGAVARPARLHAERLGLEGRISLREARESGPVLLPQTPKLGQPDGVYVTESPRDVVLVYRARPGLPSLGDTNVGLILTELPGGLASAYLPRGTDPGLREVSVDGTRGYWASAGQSAFVERTGDLRAGALLWEREGRALRLEADLPLREASRIAGSVR